MKKLLIFLAILFYSVQIIGQDKKHANTLISLLQKHKELAIKRVESFPNHTEISVGIIYKGVVSYLGFKRLNDSTIVVDNHDKVYEIGSISKVFTATMLASLVQDSILMLNDPINKYVNYPIKTNHEITFIQLSNHTSGLPGLPNNLELTKAKDPKNPYNQYNIDKLKKYLAQPINLNSTPGKAYSYSNLGAGLLGCILSDLSNRSYEDLLQKEIVAKYNMQNTTTLRPLVKYQLVPGLDSLGDITPNWDLNIFTGAGGILSTVGDLSKFAEAQFDSINRTLTLTRHATFSLNNVMSVGLGWHILNPNSANPWVWHNGGTGGYSSCLILDVKKKNGIIVLSNVSGLSSGMGVITNLSFSLMKYMYN